jgi:hypothetical protein
VNYWANDEVEIHATDDGLEEISLTITETEHETKSTPHDSPARNGVSNDVSPSNDFVFVQAENNESFCGLINGSSCKNKVRIMYLCIFIIGLTN